MGSADREDWTECRAVAAEHLVAPPEVLGSLEGRLAELRGVRQEDSSAGQPEVVLAVLGVKPIRPLRHRRRGPETKGRDRAENGTCREVHQGLQGV